MSIENKTEQQTASGSLVPHVPFNELLPKDFNLVALAPQVVAEQQAVFQDRTYTYLEALARTSEMHPASFADFEQRNNAISTLVLSDTALILADQFDPLEEYRKNSGLVERREYLMNRLLEQLSFERGFEVFAKTAEVLGKKYESMADINQDYPHLTKTEIVLLSLVERAPAYYLFMGHPSTYRPQSEEEVDCHLVPVMTGATIDGLVVMPDAHDPNSAHAYDVYSNAGIVGATETLKIVPFTPEVKKIIDELIPLIISNNRLHERVWAVADSALVDGMGKLDRVALERVLGTKASKSLSQVISQLTPEQMQSFREEQQKLNRAIASAILINPQNSSPLEPEDVVKLIGMLHQVPEALLDSQRQFEGFFTPFGPGILFLDGAGKPINYTPYHPYYLRDVMQGLYVEQIDAQKGNRSMAVLFNQLSSQAEGIVMTQVEETGEDPSILEGLQIELKLRFGIDLEIGPRAGFSQISLNDSLDAGSNVYRPTIKFAAEEAKQVLEVLNVLPRQFLEGVKSFRKVTQSRLPMEELMSGEHNLATFDKRSGTVSLYQTIELPFVKFTPEMLAQRAFAVTHEIGHNVWVSLSDEQKRVYREVSWGQNSQSADQSSNFLTSYSHRKNEEEDFCEHFASFVFHGGEFRERGETADGLFAKYGFMKNLFSAATGNVVEYPQIVPWTIEEIHGSIDAQIKRMTAEELTLVDQQNIENTDILAAQAREGVIKSVDRHTASDVIDPEELGGEHEPITTLEQLEGVKRKQMELDFKRQTILEISSYFSESLSERQAVGFAKEIYQLIEDEELEQIDKIISQFIDDQDCSEELMELIEDTKLMLDGGTYIS